MMAENSLLKTRLASFFWMQSLINSHEKRRMLYQMDTVIQSLRTQVTLVDDILDETKATLWIHHGKDEFDKLKKSPYFYQ